MPKTLPAVTYCDMVMCRVSMRPTKAVAVLDFILPSGVRSTMNLCQEHVVYQMKLIMEIANERSRANNKTD